MDYTVARRLVSSEGRKALDLAGAEADPDSLLAATRLRQQIDGDLAVLMLASR